MLSRASDRVMIPLIVVISILAPLLLLGLIFLPIKFSIVNAQVGTLPFFHATLNFATAVLLIIGYYFARSHKVKWHRNTMISAFVLSCIFLVSYVISKLEAAPTHFGGEGWISYIYFFILITHIMLSAIIVPLVLFTLYRGLSGNIAKHRKIARWTLPVWLYVAITGVLVYIFMAPYY